MKSWKRGLAASVFSLGLLVGNSGCESDAQTGALIGALAGAGIGQLAGRDTESTLIGAGIGAGVGYLYGSKLDKERKLRVDRTYRRLMQLDDGERIIQEIDLFADYEFGKPKDGWTSPSERDRAYQAFMERWEFEQYRQGLNDRLFVQVLMAYRGY